MYFPLPLREGSGEGARYEAMVIFHPHLASPVKGEEDRGERHAVPLSSSCRPSEGLEHHRTGSDFYGFGYFSTALSARWISSSGSS